MEEKQLFDDTSPMLRLSAKGKLIKDTSGIFEGLEKHRESWPKALFKVGKKNIGRDFKKGLRQINKKIPVYIEMPKLKKEGNGQYSEVHYDDPPDKAKEIIVGDSPALNNSAIDGFLDYDELKK